MAENNHFTALLHKYAAGNITAAEEKEFFTLLQQHTDDPELEAVLWESYQQSDEQQFWSEDYRKVFAARIMERLDASAATVETPVRRMKKIYRYAVAAAVLVMLSAGAYLWFSHRSTPEDPLAAASKTIRPGTDGAVLTLHDGSQVVLDSLADGVVASETNARILLKDGKISYDVSKETPREVTYNTMTTPRGRQFQLVLPDGTKVWLNAASSLRYPTAFTGKQRLVELDGEAYFEVAQHASIPFKVKTNDGAEVDVLGTRFNINAYRNEEVIATTLLEGSVRVNAFSRSIILKPRQQSLAQRASQQQLLAEADINKVMAWKNGYFDFYDETLPLMMRQLERWYDIEVKYEGKIPGIVFKGKMDRNVELVDLVRFLTMFGIRARLEERTLIISGS